MDKHKQPKHDTIKDMLNPDILEYIRQSRRNNVSDQDIIASMQASGWDLRTIQENFKSLDRVPHSFNPANLKKPLVLGIFAVTTLAVFFVFVYTQGMFPFSGAPYTSNTIFQAVAKVGDIKSASYKLGIHIKSQPREADAKSMVDSVPALKARQELLNRDVQRYKDLSQIRVDLINYSYKNSNKYPQTLAQANTKTTTDPQGKAYQYQPISNRSDYNITVTFETAEAVKAAMPLYESIYNQKPIVNDKTVTFNKSNSPYQFDGKPKLPQFVGVFDTPSQYLNFVRGNIDLELNVLGDTQRDVKNPTDTRFQMVAKLNFGDFNMEGDIEFLKKDEDYYVKLNKFPALFFDVTKIKGKWVQVTSADLTASGFASLLDYGSGSFASYQQKQGDETLDAIEKFFTIAHEESVIVVQGSPKKEIINDKTSYKYSLAFNKEKLAGFYDRLSKEFKDEWKDNKYFQLDDPTATEYLKSEEFSQIFEYLSQNNTWDVWINSAGYPVKLAYSYRYIPDSETQKTNDQEYILSLDLELSNINKNFKYDVPAEYMKYEDAQTIFSGKTKEEYNAEKAYSSGGARGRARDAKRIAETNQLRTAAELYFDDNGYYPQVGSYAELSSLFVPKYLTVMPVDPTNTAPYGYKYAHKGKTQYQFSAVLEGWGYSLDSDADINSTIGGWVGQTVNGSKDSKTDCTAPSAVSCIYDQGQN